MWPEKWDLFVEPDGLLLEPDPFSRARRIVPAQLITQVCIGWWPSSVRLSSGEYLFVPQRLMRQLADLAQAHQVPFVHRADLWSWILEPFLDTEFSLEARARTLELLEQNRVEEAELEAIRARVGERMMTMTTVSWEWNHYGLFDVLCAMRAQGESRFAAFKAEAFAIADRGLVTSGTKDEFLAFAPPEDAQG
jgi:hypothetical protein